MKSEKTKKIIKLHRQGKSTREIAKMFDMKKNSVITLLRYHNCLRPSPGSLIELQVVEYFKRQGHKVNHMRGDWPYDFEMEGVTYDVKSAKRGKTGGYYFSLHHRQSVSDNRDVLDYYIFVFKGVGVNDLYKSSSSQFEHIKRTFCLRHPAESLSSKYTLEFVGKIPRK